jgi:hypothetical protein
MEHRNIGFHTLAHRKPLKMCIERKYLLIVPFQLVVEEEDQDLRDF